MTDPDLRWDMPIPFGVHAGSGQPLDGLNEAVLAAFQEREQQRQGIEIEALKGKAQNSEAHFGVSADEVDDPNNLGQAGWGVLFTSTTTPEIRQALEPLLKIRREQSGRLFRVFEGQDGFLPSDGDVYGWLARHKVNLDQPVNPGRGVPYYLLIVAPPEEISFEFQYALDIQWAVGRLWFPAVEEFQRYADSVVNYESASAVPTSRQVAVFAPEHEFDRATQLFARHVAQPLTDVADPLGRKRKFAIQSFLGGDATRSNLHRIWSGSLSNGPPALVFSGSHGMAFSSGDPGQEADQGAILCQDWEGFGKIRRDQYYAASDLPTAAKVHGMLHFFFACYSAGWPRVDSFGERGQPASTIAPQASLARLPQALLAHPEGGALAVIGHVDRAWAYSFRSVDKVGQIDSIRDTAARLLRGDRVGNAMDQFNQRWATLSQRLADLQDQRSLLNAGTPGIETQSAKQLGTLWVARDDARNYIVFGDPAVQLRVQDMQELPAAAG